MCIHWTYCTAQSNAACAIPIACPATPIRPPSNVVIAILKPVPFSPNKFPLGILQSSKLTVQVEEPRMPVLTNQL